MSIALPKSRDWGSLIPIAAGIAWVTIGNGFGAWLLAWPQGLLLIATGVAALLWPGDSRITHYTSDRRASCRERVCLYV